LREQVHYIARSNCRIACLARASAFVRIADVIVKQRRCLLHREFRQWHTSTERHVAISVAFAGIADMPCYSE
jgi:hypothetical protein